MTGPVEWLEHQFALAASARAKVAAGKITDLTEEERAAMRSTSATPGDRHIAPSLHYPWPPHMTRWRPMQPGPDDWRAHP